MLTAWSHHGDGAWKKGLGRAWERVAEQVICRDPESSPLSTLRPRIPAPNCLFSQDPRSRLLAPFSNQDPGVWVLSLLLLFQPRSPEPQASPPSNPGVWASSPLLLQDPGARGPEYTAAGCFHGDYTGWGEHFLGPESANTQGSLKVMVPGRSQPAPLYPLPRGLMASCLLPPLPPLGRWYIPAS